MIRAVLIYFFYQLWLEHAEIIGYNTVELIQLGNEPLLNQINHDRFCTENWYFNGIQTLER